MDIITESPKGFLPLTGSLKMVGNLNLGGNELIGDNVSGGDLKLKSTSNATKGSITFGSSAYDETNNKLGLGINNPSARLELASHTSAEGGILFGTDTDLYRGDVNLLMTSGIFYSEQGFIGTPLFGGGESFGDLTIESTLNTPKGNILLNPSGGNVGIGNVNPILSSLGKLHISGDGIRIDTSRTLTTSGDTGNQGEVCWDNNYVYVCISTNSWKRIPLSVF